MSHLIIIEGLDGVGKSTFADHLWSQAGTPAARFHVGPPVTTDYLTEYWQPLAFLGQHTVICDRWHVGEHVWPGLITHRPQMDTLMTLLENRMRLKFEKISAYFMYRDVDGMMSCRDIDYDIEAACDLYDDAIDRSTLEWEYVTLDEVVPHVVL